MEVVHAAITRRNYNANIVSTGEEEANDKIKTANMLYSSTPDVLEPYGFKPVRWKNSLSELAFHPDPFTSTITSKPGTSAIRGGKKDIYVDEAAFIAKFPELWQGALPAITRGECRATVISTPFGESGLYYEMWSKGENWSRHIVPWWESRFMVKGAEGSEDPYAVVAEAVRYAPEMKTIDRINRFGSEQLKLIFTDGLHGDLTQFQTEYECTFVDEADSFITWDLINSNSYPDGHKDWRFWPLDYETQGHITIGVDLAKKRDSTVFTVVEHVDGKKYVRFLHETHETYETQFRELQELVLRTRASRVSIDAGGPGAMFAEKANAGGLGPRVNVELVTFTNTLKEQWATQFKGELQVGNTVYLMNNGKHREQIHGVKRKRLESGLFKFSGEPHDDYFWSLMLSLYGNDRIPVKFSRIG